MHGECFYGRSRTAVKHRRPCVRPYLMLSKNFVATALYVWIEELCTQTSVINLVIFDCENTKLPLYSRDHQYSHCHEPLIAQETKGLYEEQVCFVYNDQHQVAVHREGQQIALNYDKLCSQALMGLETRQGLVSYLSQFLILCYIVYIAGTACRMRVEWCNLFTNQMNA